MPRYRYELRKGGELIATGHLDNSEELEVGDRVEVAGSSGIVRTIEPLLGEYESRVLIELLPPRDQPGTS